MMGTHETHGKATQNKAARLATIAALALKANKRTHLDRTDGGRNLMPKSGPITRATFVSANEEAKSTHE